MGVRASRARRAPRLRADRGRRAAGRALAHRARAARARTARGPPHGGRGVRRRGRGDHDRRRAAPRAGHARLGRGGVRAGPGDRRLGLAAGPRGPVGAGQRARGARARLPGAARGADVLGRSPRRAIAASPITRSPCSTCCWRPSRSRCPRACARPSAPTCARVCGAVFGGAMPSRPGLELDVERPGRASPATTGAARASTCPRTPPPDCRRRRWAAG